MRGRLAGGANGHLQGPYRWLTIALDPQLAIPYAPVVDLRRQPLHTPLVRWTLPFAAHTIRSPSGPLTHDDVHRLSFNELLILNADKRQPVPDMVLMLPPAGILF